ncbi:MAG: peroxide stress protein YaaA [Bacteroidales bacterium]
MANHVIILSPSKSLSEVRNENPVNDTQPLFIDKSIQIVNEIKQCSLSELKTILGVSPKLAQLNWLRYQDWSAPFDLSNSRQAILSFSGDVYDGLRSSDFDLHDFEYSQNHLRILSGLYGLLRPLDLIQPYRLEMGSSFKVQGRLSLYSFWRETITNELNSLLGRDDVLINLASNEYFKVVDLAQLKATVLNIEFRENKPDGLKVIPILAKRARGLMARYAIKSGFAETENLKLFDYEGYMYSDPLSTSNKWVFIR